MKAFITRYALSVGIEVVEAEDLGDGNGMIQFKDDRGYRQYASGADWHLTIEAAVERAKYLCVAKIASHRKSISKLEKLTFAVPV